MNAFKLAMQWRSVVLCFVVPVLVSCRGGEYRQTESMGPPVTEAPREILAQRLSSFGLRPSEVQLNCVEAAISGNENLALFAQRDVMPSREQTVAFFDVLYRCEFSKPDFAGAFLRGLRAAEPLTAEQETCLRAQWLEADGDVVIDVVTAAGSDASDAFALRAIERCGVSSAGHRDGGTVAVGGD